MLDPGITGDIRPTFGIAAITVAEVGAGMIAATTEEAMPAGMSTDTTVPTTEDMITPTIADPPVASSMVETDTAAGRASTVAADPTVVAASTADAVKSTC